MSNAPDLQVYEDIKTRLQARITPAALKTIGYEVEGTSTLEVQLWNNQFKAMADGKFSLVQFPFIIVGFVQSQPWKQLGNGVQFLDPFDVRIRIIFEWFSDGDAHDVDVNEAKMQFQVRQLVYEALQEFEPTCACKMVRISEQSDEDHDNIIQYVQTYRSNLIDSTMQRPIGGTEAGTITLEIDPNIVTEITLEEPI